MFYITDQMRAIWSSAEGDFLPLAGIKQALDAYFLRPLEGRKAICYVREYTLFWKRLLAFSKQLPYWPEASSILLTFTFQEQKSIEKEIRRNVRKSDQITAQSVSVPGWNEESIVCFKVFGRDVISAGAKKIKSECQRLLASGKPDHAFIYILDNNKLLTPVEMIILTNRHRPACL